MGKNSCDSEMTHILVIIESEFNNLFFCSAEVFEAWNLNIPAEHHIMGCVWGHLALHFKNEAFLWPFLRNVNLNKWIYNQIFVATM